MFDYFYPHHSHWRHNYYYRRMGMGRLLMGLLFAPLVICKKMLWHGGYGGYGRYGWHDGWHDEGHGGCHGWRGGPRGWRGGYGGPREWRGPHGPDYV